MLAAWFGGLGPGLLATLLGAGSLSYFFEGPPYALTIESLTTVVDLAVFVLVAWLISSLSANLRDARAHAERAHGEADTARQVAEEAVRIRDGFLASVAHDLRSPLTAIKGQSNLLRRRLARQEDPEHVAWVHRLDTISATVSRMDSAIDELLDVARLRAGGPLPLRPAPVELAPLVRRVVDAQRELHPQRRIDLSLRGVPIVGLWDERRLERVVENLVGNALKYSPDGGDVHVEVARDDTPTGAWAVVRVRDQGVGIPRTELVRVFEPFWRASNVAGQIRGTGVGLASASQIVRQHGGRIEVASQEGQGSTFTVSLPLGAASPAAAEPLVA
jgi:signal transduction histidine kinase